MITNLPPAKYGAWNPGLESQLPREYLPLSTIFRNENVSTSAAKAYELSEFCGLPAEELVAFRVERLIVHELLIHVMAGIAVPDGRDDEDLGRNFRKIVATILNRYIASHRDGLALLFGELRHKSSMIIVPELERALTRSKAADDINQPGRSRFLSIFYSRKSSPQPETIAERDQRIVSEWRKKSKQSDDRLTTRCFAALHRVATAIISKHGRLLGDNALLTDLALTLVCNDFGSEVIGQAILPFIQKAVACEGYRFLSRQEKPVVMNVKGAAASGKSTMRPLQKLLAGKLNFPWEEFALISPDIWRKFLLDYAALGTAYKYAGMLTGHEVEIIDRKLDVRMAERAIRGEMPHLLIDRFRFDSFVPNLEEGSSRLLTRFGNLVYMFFMITPPETTVERAWARGLKLGRYKAVEDVLAHNVEAYAGMPELFFTWALIAGKRVHYEFLDNSVAQGCPPRTVAFGWNKEMTILDVKAMIDIERFRKINIRAQRTADVYASVDLSPQSNVDFLKRCVRWIPVINFADYETGQLYARLQGGKWVWRDKPRFDKARDNPETKAGLLAIARNVDEATCGAEQKHTDVAIEKIHTLGAWGEAAPASAYPS
ncbi:MAG: hypothetical protein WAK55_17175 [Xanthobacteraceae bacterium]